MLCGDEVHVSLNASEYRSPPVSLTSACEAAEALILELFLASRLRLVDCSRCI